MLPIFYHAVSSLFVSLARAEASCRPFCYLFVLQLSHQSPPSQLCNVFAFPGSYQWCCRSCQSLHLSEMSLAPILERSSVGICMLCVELVLLLGNSQMLLFLCCLSISCLRGILQLLASEWYSRWLLWRVVKLSPFSSEFSGPHHVLFHVIFSSSSCTCSSFSNILTLYVAIFSRSLLCGGSS